MSVESVKALYRRTLDGRATVRRYSNGGRSWFEAAAQARIVGYAPNQLAGPVQQGDRRAVVYADDLIENGLTLPVTTNDKLVVRGRELAIIAADDSTRRVDGVLIAYELQVRG